MPYEIEITGIDELVSKFAAGETQATLELMRAMNESLTILQKDGETYPPEAAANRPPPPFYIRGVGTQYGVKNRRESLNMRIRWMRAIKNLVNGLEGSVGIPDAVVPYAKFVMGWKTQTDVHKGTDRAAKWDTDAEIAERNAPEIVHKFLDAAKRIADFLNR